MGELTVPGERLVVAQGGRGGAGTLMPSPEKLRMRAQRAEQQAAKVCGCHPVVCEGEKQSREGEMEGELRERVGLLCCLLSRLLFCNTLTTILPYYLYLPLPSFPLVLQR